MMESFMIDLFVRSLVVLAGVGVAVFAVRRASAAVRSLVWRVGIGLLLALPAMMALLPKWTLAWLPAAPEPVAAGLIAQTPVVHTFSWIVAVYAVGVAVGLMRLVASFAAASLITRRGVVVERTPEYRILLSKEAPMPFAFGLHRPSVVLPAFALDWDAAVRDDVVAHEAAHVGRQDWLWLLLGRIAAVLYWPNFGVTWMLHRARMDAEMAADDQVVAAGQDQVLYAEHLVRVARACQSTALLAPMAAEPPLTTRLRSLLSGDIRRNAPGRPAAHAAFIMGLLLIGPFAAMGFGPQMGASVAPPPPRWEEMAKPAVAEAVDSPAVAQEAWVPPIRQSVTRIRSAEERTANRVFRSGRAAPAPRPAEAPALFVPPAAPQAEEAPLETPITPVEAVESQSSVGVATENIAQTVQVGGASPDAEAQATPGQQVRASRSGE